MDDYADPLHAQHRIRLLTGQDLPAYKALRDELLRDFPEAFTSDYATECQRSFESYAPRISAPEVHGNKLWGAFDTKSNLVGSIALEVATRAQQRHIGTVAGMFVARAAQGQGLATLLIANLIDFIRASDQFDSLTLTVTASNTYVVRLYEKAGFTSYGLLPRAICVNGVFHDKLLMRWERLPAAKLVG